jgi:histone-lysine N-methyltransferase SETMAR
VKLKICTRVIQKVKTTRTLALLADLVWDVFFYPPYSPNLAASDFNLFIHLKQVWCGTRMGSDEEVNKTIRDWFSGVAAEFYSAGTQKLITQYDKCLNLHGNYVEK